MFDLAPLLLDAANAEVSDEMTGQSVRLLMDEGKPNPAWRDDMFLQVSESAAERALRNDRWKYVAYAPEKGGFEAVASREYVERDVYDFRMDFYEQVNLVGPPGLQ